MSFPGQLTSLVHYKKSSCGRAALCISGSLTVEAAVILPLFMMAMLTLVSVLDVCRIQIEKQAELAEKAKRLSVYAYMTEEYLQEEYIDLYEIESCELLVSLIPGYRIPLALRGRVHTWTGRSEAECAADADSMAEQMVYVTENQSVYHVHSDCTYLELSIYGVSKGDLSTERNKDGSRYTACEKCCGEHISADYYYISDSGEHYHISRDCSGLTRKVKLVPLSEVGHLSVCSRCGNS